MVGGSLYLGAVGGSDLGWACADRGRPELGEVAVDIDDVGAWEVVHGYRKGACGLVVC